MKHAQLLARGSLLITLALAGGSAAQAAPILAGDTVTLSLGSIAYGPVTSVVVVGAGAEWTIGGYSVDIGDTYLQITSNGNFCGFVCGPNPFTLAAIGLDFSPIAAISAVSLFDSGMSAYNGVFTPNSVSFDMLDAPQSPGAFARIDFRTSEIPEPSTLALALAAGLGMALRRRR